MSWSGTSRERLRRRRGHVARHGPAINALGYFYDMGIGTRRNSARALRWYRRAAGKGSAIAASNVGTIYRDRAQSRQALKWFRRAVELGDKEALLEIARLKSQSPRGSREAIASLTKLLQASISRDLTPAILEDARKLLANLEALKAGSAARK